MRRVVLFFVFVLATCLPACRAAQTPFGPPPPPAPLWTDDERAAIVAYWNAPGRYAIGSPPDAGKNGPWQVRLTADGSTWLLQYQRVVAGSAKLPPTTDAHALTGDRAGWEAWVTARVAYDRWAAQQAADSANGAFRAVAVKPVPPPPLPGPAPASLVAACGNPPAFARAAAPLQYTITFDDNDPYSYSDNVKMRDRYAYYRFPQGVNTEGVAVAKMPDDERKKLFVEAGLTEGEQHIFEAISKLEGGFDAVQTYDTGFVSIGFIQFVTLAEGRHDLSNVLQSEKTDRPDDYKSDFHRFGIDVRPDKTMVVVDPNTGAELSGPDAVMKVIDDKRLLAVFQRAGRKTPFRVAQIKVAKAFYWPTDDAVIINLPGGGVLNGKVSDCIKSEAGIATLLDRKINVGNWRPLPDVVARVMTSHKCKFQSLAEAAPFEKEIIAALKYRADFQADKTLTQP